MATPNIGDLDLSDTEDLFASPSRATSKANGKPGGKSASITANGNGESKYDAEQARETALKRELESVRSINIVIEGVISSLERAKGNMDTVSQTVNSASTLLNTWTRILSQTEHNQRLLLDENWRGASQDVTDMENESVLKAHAAERRAAEDETRREEARRRSEDEERAKQAGTVPARGKGVVRGAGRGRAVNSGQENAGGQSGTSSRGLGRGGARGGSGIGRGVGSTRGRGRGVR